MDLTYLVYAVGVAPSVIALTAYFVYANRVRTKSSVRLAWVSGVGLAVGVITTLLQYAGLFGADLIELFTYTNYAFSLAASLYLFKVLSEAAEAQASAAVRPAEQALQPDASRSVHKDLE